MLQRQLESPAQWPPRMCMYDIATLFCDVPDVPVSMLILARKLFVVYINYAQTFL